MGFLKQLHKDSAKASKGSFKQDLKLALLGTIIMAVGLGVALLGVMLGGTVGTVLTLVGLAVTAIGAVIATGFTLFWNFW